MFYHKNRPFVGIVRLPLGFIFPSRRSIDLLEGLLLALIQYKDANNQRNMKQLTPVIRATVSS